MQVLVRLAEQPRAEVNMFDSSDEQPFADVREGERVCVENLVGTRTTGTIERFYNGPEGERRARVKTGENEYKDFGVGRIVARY